MINGLMFSIALFVGVTSGALYFLYKEVRRLTGENLMMADRWLDLKERCHILVELHIVEIEKYVLEQEKKRVKQRVLKVHEGGKDQTVH